MATGPYDLSGRHPRTTRDHLIQRDDRHVACKEVEQKLREANRRLQAQGPELERDKLIVQLRDHITLLEGKLQSAKNDIKDLRSDIKDDDALRERMGKLLTGVAEALRGPQPSGVLYDWADLPALVTKELEIAYMSGITDGACLFSRSGVSDAHMQSGFRDYTDARLDRLKVHVPK